MAQTFFLFGDFHDINLLYFLLLPFNFLLFTCILFIRFL